MKEYFDVTYRNPGHWDIYDKTKRLCKIRGEAGNFCVYNDYGDFTNKEGFATVAEAMQYITNHLMYEPELAVFLANRLGLNGKPRKD